MTSTAGQITLPGSPEKNLGVGTYGPIRRPRIPLFKGEESVIRLSLGRRLVNLLPVAQRTNAFTNSLFLEGSVEDTPGFGEGSVRTIPQERPSTTMERIVCARHEPRIPFGSDYLSRDNVTTDDK